jgi:hypothetical protein
MESGEAPVPAPARLASCVTEVSPLPPPPVYAIAIELPEGVTLIPLPGVIESAPVREFRLVTPAVLPPERSLSRISSNPAFPCVNVVAGRDPERITVPGPEVTVATR